MDVLLGLLALYSSVGVMLALMILLANYPEDEPSWRELFPILIYMAFLWPFVLMRNI